MQVGNTGPVQEFNLQVDPEAAKIVFESGVVWLGAVGLGASAVQEVQGPASDAIHQQPGICTSQAGRHQQCKGAATCTC
jgi:inosine-uridine nucleoside N-ribohydrolase